MCVDGIFYSHTNSMEVSNAVPLLKVRDKIIGICQEVMLSSTFMSNSFDIRPSETKVARTALPPLYLDGKSKYKTIV